MNQQTSQHFPFCFKINQIKQFLISLILTSSRIFLESTEETTFFFKNLHLSVDTSFPTRLIFLNESVIYWDKGN